MTMQNGVGDGDGGDGSEWDDLDAELQRFLAMNEEGERAPDAARPRGPSLNPDNATHAPLPPRERSLEEFLSTSARNIELARRSGQRAVYARYASRSFPDFLLFAVDYLYERTPDINTRTVVYRLLVEQGVDVLQDLPAIRETHERSRRDRAELTAETAWVGAIRKSYTPRSPSLLVHARELLTITFTEEDDRRIDTLRSTLGIFKYQVIALAFMAAYARSELWIPADLCRICHAEIEQLQAALANDRG